MSSNAPACAAWSQRWWPLARAAGLRKEDRLTLALSGGADSVLLVHLAAAAEPRPALQVVHVHHGLRGEEADRDARFCARLAHDLGLPYRERRLDLEPGPGLEARARRARYRALAEAALAGGYPTLVTGHHEDDTLETLLLRWLRGSDAAGWHGPLSRLDRVPGVEDGEGLSVVRPLLPLRREEVRRLLRDHGLTWREDSSNDDPAFSRNRARHGLLPLIEEVVGPEARDGLLAFGRAVEELEDRLAAQTCHLAWSPPPYAAATRGPRARALGGTLPRGSLMRLPRPLQRRVLWRLLQEGTGHGPSRQLVDRILDDLGRGRTTRHTLPGSWRLRLRSDLLDLVPPPERVLGEEREAQLALPFDPPGETTGNGAPRELPVPGRVRLDDGRCVTAELVDEEGPARGSEREVVLDAAGLPRRLTVRWSRPGDRFRGLGAPGTKRLSRFLADRGVPSEERRRVPLVLAEDEIVWVVGLEPAESRRVRPDRRRRVRLTLH